MKDFFVLDIETGGLDPKANAICSVCAIILNGETLQEKGRYYTLVKDDPSKIIKEEALAINKLTLKEIDEEGEEIDDVIRTLKTLLNGSVFVAQNAAFDAAFLNEHGMNIKSAVDTLVIYRERFPGQPAKLSNICSRFGIPVSNAHNAEADVEMTCEVLRKYKSAGIALREDAIKFRR